jgi:predicted ABC-type ATPase
MERPHLIVLAGPNGAGKSTVAPALLVGALGVDEFVNADVIAQGLSAFQAERAALPAGRIMLDRLHYLAARRLNFAFETTLASRSFAPWIEELRGSGYLFHLLFLWLPSPEMAIRRVADRVLLGGHDVPPETIRRRYRAGLRNFFELYRRLTDRWQFYDNSQAARPRLLAEGSGAGEEIIAAPAAWEGIVRRCASEGGHGSNR